MWYVIQVKTGTEESILIQCQKNIPDTILENCFIPCYEEKKRIRGVWTIQKRRLFPGYVFLVAGNLEQISFQLKHIIGRTRLLGIGDEIIPLTDEEIQFLVAFGGEKQVVEMSEGIIEGAEVKILSGPLQGREALIRKIDRHKRKAYLELKMFGRMQKVQVGLEIVEKIK